MFSIQFKSGNIWRGYIAMLAVDSAFRKQSIGKVEAPLTELTKLDFKIGSDLVLKSIDAMKHANCDEV
jgi:hypothetical protein